MASQLHLKTGFFPLGESFKWLDMSRFPGVSISDRYIYGHVPIGLKNKDTTKFWNLWDRTWGEVAVQQDGCGEDHVIRHLEKGTVKTVIMTDVRVTESNSNHSGDKRLPSLHTGKCKGTEEKANTPAVKRVSRGPYSNT